MFDVLKVTPEEYAVSGAKNHPVCPSSLHFPRALEELESVDLRVLCRCADVTQRENGKAKEEMGSG